MMTIVCGPYIGGLEQELFTFHPHVNWIYNALMNRCEQFYIFSHQQHSFLYNWPNATFIPINLELSDECFHSGIINNQISNKDYISLLKATKNSIDDNKDIIHVYVKYTKYDNFTVPLSKKLFKRIEIDVDIDEDLTDQIIVMGGETDSIISQRIIERFDALEIHGSYPRSPAMMLKILQKARMIICPMGVWTYFANLHGVPVVSWGNGNGGIGMYKEDGPYYFNNKESHIISITNGNMEPIIDGIEYLMNRLGE